MTMSSITVGPGVSLNFNQQPPAFGFHRDCPLLIGVKGDFSAFSVLIHSRSATLARNHDDDQSDDHVHPDDVGPHPLFPLPLHLLPTQLSPSPLPLICLYNNSG